MTKYKTIDIDYTGCHPVIAEHLKQNKAILCKVGTPSSEGPFPVMIFAYTTGECPYVSENLQYLYAEPIPESEPKVKKASEVMKALEDEGYEVDEDGFWMGDGPTFVPEMWQYCGKVKPDTCFWKKSWLEED
jgi:hypothetical protein